MNRQSVILLALGLMSWLPLSASAQQMAPLLDLSAEAKKAEAKTAPAQPEAKPRAEAPKPTVSAKAVEATPQAKDLTPPHWGYLGKEAPRFWADLSAEYALCKTGRNQSPINLKDQAAVGTTGLAGFDVYYRETALKIIDTGHTVQVNIPLGSYIKINGHRYELVHYNFHTPSEHQKDGFNYPMEMHLVHRDGEGNLAIIGIIFQEGETNETLADLMRFLPDKENKQVIHEEVKIHPAKFFPLDKRFYKYSGSLTTPPCSEGVYWMVFKQPVEASVRQLEKMNEYLGANARPIQPLQGRTLLKSWPDKADDSSPFYEFY